MQISAAHNGGKAANAGFPPLREEEKLFGEAENLQFDPTPFFMLFSPLFFFFYLWGCGALAQGIFLLHGTHTSS